MKSSERFHKTVLEFLDTISSCIHDLRGSSMTTLSSFQLDIAKSYLEAYPGTDLLLSFVENNKYWKHIHSRDSKFITDELPLIYKDVGIDVNILVCPFECYEEHGDKCPVTKEDIDIIWEYFDAMTRIACNFIVNARVKDPKYMPEVVIEEYASLLGFKPTLD